MAQIAQLVVYPVKACAGMEVTATEVGPRGLAHDRTFMVVDDEGTFRNQIRDPVLARITPRISADGASLELSASGTAPVKLPVDPDGDVGPVTLYGASYTGADQGADAAEWLSEVLGARSRLVCLPRDHHRVTGGLVPGTSGFADSTAVLMTSLASLDLLNERLAGSGGQALPMERFRPNIVVGDWAEPHTEDRARGATVGTAELGFAKLCIRCAVTTVDQERGVKDGPEPLRALAGYRRVDEGGVAFGAKFAVTRSGRVAVGDPVDVTAWEEGDGSATPGGAPHVR